MVQKTLPFAGKHLNEILNGTGGRNRFQKVRDWFLRKFSIPAISFMHDKQHLEFFAKNPLVDKMPRADRKNQV